MVYDASARADGNNCCLYAGPKFEHIVLGFQTHKITLTPDIEKAFLMISVAEGDRDALRFLWVDDATKEDPRQC